MNDDEHQISGDDQGNDFARAENTPLSIESSHNINKTPDKTETNDGFAAENEESISKNPTQANCTNTTKKTTKNNEKSKEQNGGVLEHCSKNVNDEPVKEQQNGSALKECNGLSQNKAFVMETNMGDEGTIGIQEAATSSDSSEKKKNKEPDRVVSLKRLFQFASKLDVLFMILGSIASAINGVLQPVSLIIFGEMIDKFIENDKDMIFGEFKSEDIDEVIAPLAVYFVYFGIGAIFFGYFQNMFWMHASIHQAFKIRTLAFSSILRQDIGWFDKTDTGELSSRLSDGVTKIQNGIGDKIASLLHGFFMLTGGIIVGFVYSWKLTLVIVAVSPLLFIGAFAIGKVIGVITSEEQSSYAKAGAIAEEVLSAIKTVVAFGGERKEIERYKENLRVAEKAGVKKGLSTGFAFGLFNGMFFGCQAIGFWYGGTLVKSGELSGGELLIVFFAIMLGAMQFGQVGPSVQCLSEARGAAYVIYDLIERKPEIDPSNDEGLKPKIIGNVILEECGFHYPSRPDIEIFKGISLNIKTGTKVALVGESGCGKSTISKLIQRFYDVSEGTVYIDDTDIKDVNVKFLRKHIGVVSQEPVLFDTSIKNNILMGNPDATEEMVVDAAKNANAYDFIQELPQGYDTNVGEGGAQLSGGQKQRIAIARALVRDPRILLLDEATSALDTKSEATVQKALDKASEGRTTVIIAHRLSTIKNANLIAVVGNKQIVETGSHEELMKKRGEYFKLVMLQSIKDQAEEEELNSEAGSIISESEREDILKRKMLRSLSKISDGSIEDSKQLQAILERHALRKSIKKREAQKKTEQVQPQEKPLNEEIPSIFKILKMNAKEWPYIAIGIFFAGLVGFMPVGFAVILAEILQSFATTNSVQLEKDMEFWSLMFLVLGFAIGISYFIAQYTFAIAGEALTTRLRETAFKTLLQQEIAFFDKTENSTGALTSRLASDASAVQGATSTRLNTMTQVVVTALSAITVAMVYSWKLTLLALAFVPFMALFGAIQTSLNISFAQRAQKKLSEAGAVASEAIMEIRTVASLGKEDFFFDKYNSLLVEPVKGQLKSAHIYAIAYSLSIGLAYFSDASCYRLGGYLAKTENLHIADIMKVIIGIEFGALTVGQVSSYASDYVKAKASAGRILKLVERVPEIDAYSQDGRRDEIKGDISFSEIEFKYPTRPNVPVLQKFSIGIPRGRTVAFVGASGCGKSTSVSLLERFYNFSGGRLEVDGIAIEDYNIRWLRSQIGIVQQEPVLFDRSIRDNILYGIENPESVTQEEVEDACRNSNIHHVISSLPHGYDTKVGEKGSLISGGQKQRIAIARALIRNPKILLLDEATSALDSESEKVVQDALDYAMEGRTSIIIAHRLSTIQNADVIAVIQGGKVLEMGNHHELLALKGAYHLLTVAQR